jgi:hypothetical protein
MIDSARLIEIINKDIGDLEDPGSCLESNMEKLAIGCIVKRLVDKINEELETIKKHLYRLP